MPSWERELPEALVAGVNLALDATAEEVCRAFSEHEIKSIVLRGPSFTEWLYGSADVRTSLDVDILVDPAALLQARDVLSTLGYLETVDTTPGTRSDHATAWRRGSGATVDLHWNLIGAQEADDRVWAEMAEHARLSTRIPGVRVPDDDARAMLVVLHAAQHGSGDQRRIEDLEAALDRVGEAGVERAAVLATKVGASEAFAAGLRLCPRGRALAEKLQFPITVSEATSLRAGPDSVTPTAAGYSWLASTESWTDRALLLSRKVVPPTAFMRDWRPDLARRGRVGLVLAYLYRPLWLAWWAPRGYLAWRRAKRTAAASQRAGGD